MALLVIGGVQGVRFAVRSLPLGGEEEGDVSVPRTPVDGLLSVLFPSMDVIHGSKKDVTEEGVVGTISVEALYVMVTYAYLIGIRAPSDPTHQKPAVEFGSSAVQHRYELLASAYQDDCTLYTAIALPMIRARVANWWSQQEGKVSILAFRDCAPSCQIRKVSVNPSVKQSGGKKKRGECVVESPPVGMVSDVVDYVRHGGVKYGSPFVLYTSMDHPDNNAPRQQRDGNHETHGKYLVRQVRKRQREHIEEMSRCAERDTTFGEYAFQRVARTVRKELVDVVVCAEKGP